MKSVIARAAMQFINEARGRFGRVRHEEGSASIAQVLVRNEDDPAGVKPYVTEDEVTVRNDINDELIKATDGANTITIELDIEGRSTYDPGDWWNPPEGDEERDVVDGRILINHGKAAKLAKTLSPKALRYFTDLFSQAIDDVHIDYEEPEPDYERD